MYRWLPPIQVGWLTNPRNFTSEQGKFAAKRKRYWHTGVDLYVTGRVEVKAVEHGVVVAVEEFTSPDMHPKWRTTQAVLVESGLHVVVYGELRPSCKVGTQLYAGDVIGHVEPVLAEHVHYILGHSRFMLHLELLKSGTRETFDWKVGEPRPKTLLDPTKFLEEAYEQT